MSATAEQAPVKLARYIFRDHDQDRGAKTKTLCLVLQSVGRPVPWSPDLNTSWRHRLAYISYFQFWRQFKLYTSRLLLILESLMRKFQIRDHDIKIQNQDLKINATNYGSRTETKTGRSDTRQRSRQHFSVSTLSEDWDRALDTTAVTCPWEKRRVSISMRVLFSLMYQQQTRRLIPIECMRSGLSTPLRPWSSLLQCQRTNEKWNPSEKMKFTQFLYRFPPWL